MKPSQDDPRAPAGEVVDPGARGFNEAIDWKNNFAEAVNEATASGKPIAVLIHNDHCGQCTRLKASLSSSPDAAAVVALAEQFVMVNLRCVWVVVRLSASLPLCHGAWFGPSR